MTFINSYSKNQLCKLFGQGLFTWIQAMAVQIVVCHWWLGGSASSPGHWLRIGSRHPSFSSYVNRQMIYRQEDRKLGTFYSCKNFLTNFLSLLDQRHLAKQDAKILFLVPKIQRIKNKTLIELFTCIKTCRPSWTVQPLRV